MAPRDLTPPEKTARKAGTEETLDAARAARLRQALVAAGEVLHALLEDPAPEIVKNSLKNPHLDEQHLLAILRRRHLPEPILKSIQRMPLLASSRRLKLALAAHPNTPPALLSSLLPQLLLFELVSLMQIPGIAPDQKLAAERAILKRLPLTELGNKITLARRGSPAILEALLKEGEPRLVEAVLANPQLKEAGVHALLTSEAATAETISAVARHTRWGARPNLRLAMLKNPKTPRIWFALFLPKLPDSELESLRHSRTLGEEQLAEVREQWKTRLQQHKN